MMVLPPAADRALQMLERAGHAAYVVGGCVRDSLLGRRPGDYDLCTSARPEEIAACFAGQTVIETGLAHGTLTVLLEGMSLEITTFRRDGPYSDGRHPEQVAFVEDLTSDLARRDFTVGAMAYHPREGLIDPFGGAADLRDRRLRCVGDPDQRLCEDALRILRALRFASVYGFCLEGDTAAAVQRQRERLRCVAAERVYAEFTKLLVGRDAGRILREFAPVVAVILPEMAPSVGFDQRNPHHIYTVYDHTLVALDHMPPEIVLRLAAFFHDLGKPSCFSVEEGIGHFYGHAAESARLAEQALRRLRSDRLTRERVVALVRRHEDPIPENEAQARRFLNRLGEPQALELLALKRGDVSAQHPALQEQRLAAIARAQEWIQKAVAERQCFSLRDLAVNGDDLLALGWRPGPAVGAVLRQLLSQVMDQRLPNDREILLRYARERLDGEKGGPDRTPAET